MSEKAGSALTEWKSVNERMAYDLQIKEIFQSLSIYALYIICPTFCADDRDKNKFYAESHLLSLLKNDMVIFGKTEIRLYIKMPRW